MPPSGTLSGSYPFVDTRTGGANTSFLEVDTGLGQVCVAGQVQGSDGAVSVAFRYASLGSVAKATEKKVRGDFVSVSLTLDIAGGASPAYGQTIAAECRLKASLLQAGSQDKVRLRCELGENYAAFPGLTSQQVTSIDNAFAEQPRARARSKTGRLKISHAGAPSGGGAAHLHLAELIVRNSWLREMASGENQLYRRTSSDWRSRPRGR